MYNTLHRNGPALLQQPEPRSTIIRRVADMQKNTTPPVLEKPCKISHIKCGRYPRVRLSNGRSKSLPRIVLEKKIGRPLLPGMQTRHLCFNKRCIEETHLAEGTKQENMLDADVKHTGTLTHFPCGHERVGENIGHHIRGYVFCVSCHRRRNRRSAKNEK